MTFTLLPPRRAVYVWVALINYLPYQIWLSKFTIPTANLYNYTLVIRAPNDPDSDYLLEI
ncbi:126_t:CDS:2 [Paraglomus brasilianum]|uniref:126_t:CDS:1 n=1 Tax=Paraglomus brasilianum TaxID=144538 RepID=A0A9N9BUX9_9GLOM|nr:126_t:CDS:2 [Paraglomus brasilianum]